MRHFLRLSYLGTRYSGWQRQKTASSVQQVIEDVLEKILHQKTIIHGCGRTDAGVHASTYFAHCDLPSTLDYDLVERANHVLPPDIALHEVIPVSPGANAQHHATQRTYEYYFHTRKDPKIHTISAYYHEPSLDLDEMDKVMQILRQTEDFYSLCKQPESHKHTRCRIDEVTIMATHEHAYRITICADRFLRGMIRYIAARTIDVGSKRLSLQAFEDTVMARRPFGYKYEKQGHPQGLFLSDVVYKDGTFLS